MSLRVVFMGTPHFAVPSLQALVEAGYDVAGVFTQPDRPKGRGGKVEQSPVKEYAVSRGIPVFQPNRIRVDGVADLRSLAPDLCVTAAFGQILSQEVLDIPPLGTVNVHASLLPRHRGAAPVQWAILQGDGETGITTMLTDKGIDTGDILLKAACSILETDTAGGLLQKLSGMGAELLLKTIVLLEQGTCPRQKQLESDATYEPMLTKEMGLLHFGEGTQLCLRRVRAMDPWPGAYARLEEGVLKVWQAAAVEDEGGRDARPGTILSADSSHGLVLATEDGAIRLIQVQAPNGKRMDARDFLRGHAMQTGRLLSEVRL
ncbi:MAG: methionyl-tRNA formyltransferase [Clostridiales bacterium]|nr:methionyl-tRNA formyltransferase [Clostridiales bacterium]